MIEEDDYVGFAEYGGRGWSFFLVTIGGDILWESSNASYPASLGICYWAVGIHKIQKWNLNVCLNFGTQLTYI